MSVIKETIWDLEFSSPIKPPKKDFINYGLPKKDQLWKREDIQSQLSKLSPTKQYDLISREFDRIINGVFILIKGEEYYLSGRFYFFLTYIKTQKGRYPEYRDVHRKFFSYFTYYYKHPSYVGIIMGKGRRFGATQIGVANCLYDGIFNENWLVGLISKDFTSIKKIFSRMLVFAFTNLPKFLKPTVSGNDKPVDKYVFSEPAKRMSKNNVDIEESGGLNSYIACAATELRSFDGDAVNFLFLDEGGKWENCSVADYFEIMKEVLKEGVEKVGFCYIPSTVADNEKKGGKEFKRLWDSSKKGANSTNLKQLFMPAYEGFVGYLDEAGFSVIDTPTPEQSAFLQKKLDMIIAKAGGNIDDIDPDDLIDPTIGAKEFLKRRRLKYTDDGLRNEEIRQYPFEEREMFLTKATNSIINPLLANEQIMRIEERKIPIRICKFYRNTITDRVEIMDDPNGMWQLLWNFDNPEVESNNVSRIYKKKRPLNTKQFGIGVDTFASSEGAAYGSGSNGVAYIKRFYTPLDPNNSDCAIARMSYRPKLKMLFFEQIFLAAEYFGCLANFENTISDFADYSSENNLDNFLLYCPEELRGTNSKILKAGTPATSKKSIEYHCNSIITDFEENYHKYWFKELLEDLIKFDVTDRTIYDDSMAWGYACICNLSCVPRNIIPEPEKRSKPLIKKHSLIKSY